MKPRVVIAGGSGLIGSACRARMNKEGYEVIILTRREKTKTGEVSWRPEAQWISEDVIDGSVAVINLCGLSLAEKRWTARNKALLLSSRIEPAYFLKTLIDKSKQPPACYLGISGIGIYGDQGTQPIHDDSSIIASGFVAELQKKWEQAHLSIDRARNVVLRTGVVITANGGFLEKLILPSRFGLYPFFGNGKQVLSWIAIDDLTRMLLYCLRNPDISGIYHATSPAGVAQKELMRIFKEVQHRAGMLFSVPPILLRIVFGELASLLFESADVRPDKMISSGFQYEYPDIRSALQVALRSDENRADQKNQP